MYKERVKSGINPILALILWFVFTYAFTVLWGICEILFEFENLLIMQFICFAQTVWFGWFLITKVLTEIEYEVYENKLTITKFLSKRSSVVCLIAKDNIKLITESREKCRKNHKGRIKSFAKPGQKEKINYIVYKDEKGTKAVKIRASKKLTEHIK